MTIGEKIRHLRKNKGLTQKELGELSKINEVQLRRYELGKSKPKYETLDKIASALEIPTAYLLYDDATIPQELKATLKLSKNFEGYEDFLEQRTRKVYREYNSQPPNIEISTLADILLDTRTNLMLKEYLLSTNNDEQGILFRVYRYLSLLNGKGREVAIKKLKELTQISEYTSTND